VSATLHRKLKVGPYQFICQKITFFRNQRYHKMCINHFMTFGFQFQLLSKSKDLYIYTYLLTCLLAYLLTYLPHGVLLEKLTGSRIVKKLFEFYETQTFITAFTSACQLSLPGIRKIRFMPSQTTSLRSILILSSHLRPGFQSCLFLSGLPT